MNYLTSNAIIQAAKEKIVFLPNQEQAVQNIATILSMHLKRVKAIENGVAPSMLPSISQLIIASTGSGKTFLISQLAKAAGLEFHTIDASMVSHHGFKGTNIGDVFLAAKQTTPSMEQFYTAVFLIDEFDKCAENGPDGESYAGKHGNIQPNLLTILEGNEIVCERGERIDTSRMLFLFSGAFQGLEDIIQNRLQKQRGDNRVGFQCADSYSDNRNRPVSFSQATMDDIQIYGFNRELLGRIGSIYYIPPLQREDYKKLLTSGKTSIQGKYNTLFEVDGVNFEISEEAVDTISAMAQERNLGARAVNSIVRESVQEAVAKVDSCQQINRVILNTRAGKLVNEYQYGERNVTTPIQTVEIELENILLESHIEDYQKLNQTCIEMVATCKHATIESQLISLLFLQVTLRYFVLYINRDEWLLSSVYEMVSCTSRKNGDLTPFDILLQDVKEKEALSVEEQIMVNYYDTYKYLEDERTFYLLTDIMQQIEHKWAGT